MPRRDNAPPGCSLLIRNLSKSCRPDELRYAAEKYGRVRDVYLPKDYYTGEPRGIGFLEYADARDAEDALHSLDRAMIHGREIQVVFAKEGRKAPDDYRPVRRSDRYDDRDRDRDRRRSYSRSPRRPRRSESPRRSRRSSSPRRSRRRSDSRSPSRGRSLTPKRRSRSRSVSRRRDDSAPPRSPAEAAPEGGSPERN